MKDDNYVPPEVNSLGDGTDKKEETEVKAPKVSNKQPTMPSFDESRNVIDIADLINAKGNATTAVLNARIDKHFEYITGKLSFSTDQQRVEEQSGFIHTVANSLHLDFPDYVVFADHLLNKIRENQDLFCGGRAFRFCHGIEKDIPLEHVQNYRNYMTMLSMVATNWQRRAQLSKFVDVTYLCRGLTKNGRVNVTQYIHKLMKV